MTSTSAARATLPVTAAGPYVHPPPLPPPLLVLLLFQQTPVSTSHIAYPTSQRRRTFAVELNGQGKRRYLVTTPDKLWATEVEPADPLASVERRLRQLEEQQRQQQQGPRRDGCGLMDTDELNPDVTGGSGGGAAGAGATAAAAEGSQLLHLYEIIRQGASCHLYFGGCWLQGIGLGTGIVPSRYVHNPWLAHCPASSPILVSCMCVAAATHVVPVSNRISDPLSCTTCTADLEYVRQYNPHADGDALVDELVVLVAEELKAAFGIRMPLHWTDAGGGVGSGSGSKSQCGGGESVESYGVVMPLHWTDVGSGVGSGSGRGAESGSGGSSGSDGSMGSGGASGTGSGDDGRGGEASGSGVQLLEGTAGMVAKSAGGGVTAAGAGAGGEAGAGPGAGLGRRRLSCLWVWELCSTTEAKFSRHLVVRIPHCAFKVRAWWLARGHGTSLRFPSGVPYGGCSSGAGYGCTVCNNIKHGCGRASAQAAA